MRSSRFQFDRWIFVVLFALGLSAAHAQTTEDPGTFSSSRGNSVCRFFNAFIDNGDGTVTDNRHGLMWKRCAEGSTWNGRFCTVEGNEMNWAEAMFLAKGSRFAGHSNWQLPSREALKTIVGDYDTCKNNRDVRSQYAVSRSIAHPVGLSNSAGWVWSSTPFEGNGNFYYVTNFGDGQLHYDFFSYKYIVRLMRPVGPQANAFAKEFDEEYEKLVASENATKARQREQLDEATQGRVLGGLQESRRKALQSKNDATKKLLAQGPQALYSLAGRAKQFGGGVQTDEVLFSATQLYEMLVEHFPNTDFASMSFAQASALIQLEALENIVRSTQSREACRAKLAQRLASCETPSRPPGCVAYVRETYSCN